MVSCALSGANKRKWWLVRCLRSSVNSPEFARRCGSSWPRPQLQVNKRRTCGRCSGTGVNSSASAPPGRSHQRAACSAPAAPTVSSRRRRLIPSRHSAADCIGVRRLPEAHGFLEARCAIQVTAVRAAVADVDGVIDATARLLGAIDDGELADRSPDGLCGALFNVFLAHGGSTSGQQGQGRG